jgi:peptide/nickel transport system substrate-binding protein
VANGLPFYDNRALNTPAPKFDAQGNKLSFRLLFRTGEPSSPKAAEFLKGYLKAVGVEVTLKGVSEDALTETIGQGNFDMFEWGWGVEPDPNYMLSTFTCENRSYVEDGTVYANLSDSFYCNPEYDKLFAAQTKETNQPKRAEIVKQMQELLYEDVPYIVTYYANNHEAYRSDRFTNFVPQPAKDGTLIYQWGSWSYQAVKSVAEASETPTASASSSAAPSASGSATPTPSASSSANTDAASNQSSSGSALPFILGGLAAAALVGVGFAFARRGGATAGTSADDRE